MNTNHDTLLARLNCVEQELCQARTQMRRATLRARSVTALASLAVGAALLIAPHDRTQAQATFPAGPGPGASLSGLLGSIGILETVLNSDEGRIRALEAKTAPLSIRSNPLRADGKRDTELFITGVNVHIVSGSGSTSDGTLSGQNKRLAGLGNLIIGYDENTDDPNVLPPTKTFYAGVTGSHNLVLGSNNVATSFGGLITGINSTVSGPHAGILCGHDDAAGGFEAAVLGGQFDQAGGDNSVIVSGYSGTTAGGGEPYGATIVGGSGLTNGTPATTLYGH